MHARSKLEQRRMKQRRPAFSSEWVLPVISRPLWLNNLRPVSELFMYTRRCVSYSMYLASVYMCVVGEHLAWAKPARINILLPAPYSVHALLEV